MFLRYFWGEMRMIEKGSHLDGKKHGKILKILSVWKHRCSSQAARRLDIVAQAGVPLERIWWMFWSLEEAPQDIPIQNHWRCSNHFSIPPSYKLLSYQPMFCGNPARRNKLQAPWAVSKSKLPLGEEMEQVMRDVQEAVDHHSTINSQSNLHGQTSKAWKNSIDFWTSIHFNTYMLFFWEIEHDFLWKSKLMHHKSTPKRTSPWA